MMHARRGSDQPESKRSRRRVTYVALLAGGAVAVAFAAAGVALWFNSSRTTDVDTRTTEVAQLAHEVRALSVRTSRDAQQTRSALCVLRSDLERRVVSSQEFLREHPRGIPGISAKAIRDAAANQQRTIDALSSIDCPGR
jgi:hypothetical protein